MATVAVIDVESGIDKPNLISSLACCVYYRADALVKDMGPSFTDIEWKPTSGKKITVFLTVENQRKNHSTVFS